MKKAIETVKVMVKCLLSKEELMRLESEMGA